MKKKAKMFIFIFLGLSLLVFIPNVYGFKVTVYMNWGETKVYSFEGKRDEVIEWKFHTYNNPFLVALDATGITSSLSRGKTSDSGSFTVLVSYVFDFWFTNNDSHGGYIDIELKIKQTILGDNLILIVITTGCIIAVGIVIRKRFIRISLPKG